MCRPLTRRQMLQYGAMAAATPLFLELMPLEALAAGSKTAIPINLELITLTETSAILTWLTVDPTQGLDKYNRPVPVPSNTQVFLGDSLLGERLVIDIDDMTPYHYVELNGLTPGKTYFYRCVSNGIPALPTVATPIPHQVAPPSPAVGVFTTPHPPPGEFLFAMAWCNDLHLGEMTSGLAYSNPKLPGGGIPPGFAVDPTNPYWRVMARAAVAESKQRGAQLMIMARDLTSEAQPIYMQEAKDTFDKFGVYKQDYFVARGNHDRAHKGVVDAGEPYSSCRPAAANGAYNDCLLDFFFPDGKTYYSFDRFGVHFVCLDTVDSISGNGAVPKGELEWFKADLKDHSHMPTFVFGHHPITEEARMINVGNTNLGLTSGFNLTNTDAIALEQAMAGSSIVGVHNGHTHRNNVTTSPLAPNIPFVELGAVKEYPGGYGMIRVFSGGFAMNFYKTKSAGARAWSELSRGEYLGLYPYYTLGNLTDRNFVATADFSDSARFLAGSPGGGGSSQAPGAGVAAQSTALPGTAAGGGDTAVKGAGLIGAAAGVGAGAIAGGRAGHQPGDVALRQGPPDSPG